MHSDSAGYRGETINIDEVLAGCLDAARRHGWEVDFFSPCALPVLRRSVAQSPRHLYLSAGIHGDEPAGPLAIQRLLQLNPWPDPIEIWLFPCLNPTGFPLNTRENRERIDLNRDYLNPRTQEIQAHVAWLESGPFFDMTFCLHEDWEAHGFYLYELNPDRQPSLAERMVSDVRAVCPVDPSPTIDGRPAQNGIIRPEVNTAARPDWPEAFYLIEHKTRLSYTLEAPSGFPMERRVSALVAAVQSALRHLVLP